MIKAVKYLSAFAAVCLLLLTALNQGLKEKIQEANERFLLSSFREIAPEKNFDANFLAEKITINHATISGSAFCKDKIFFLQSSTNQGYSGEIKILSAFDAQTNIKGVRVLEHKETAGLGDKIELKKSAWILSFNHKNKSNIFKLKKDGGEFDAFTGATITPRAIVNHIDEIIKNLENLEAYKTCTQIK